MTGHPSSDGGQRLCPTCEMELEQRAGSSGQGRRPSGGWLGGPGRLLCSKFQGPFGLSPALGDLEVGVFLETCWVF
jgi:hypothetical protein